MDYGAEQALEITALEAIYADDFRLESGSYPAKFSIALREELIDDGRPANIGCTLHVSFTERYPQEAPEVLLLHWSEDVCEEDRKETATDILGTIEQNLGSPMVFTLTDVVQNHLSIIGSSTQRRRRELREKKLAEAELARQKEKEMEESRQPALHEPMTYEQFLSWKSRFDEENSKHKVKTVTEGSGRRLTGREQFLRDTSLITSDVHMISENGDDVIVDETLFEDGDVAASSDSEVE